MLRISKKNWNAFYQACKTIRVIHIGNTFTNDKFIDASSFNFYETVQICRNYHSDLF
jgi:hypothetical protein